MSGIESFNHDDLIMSATAYYLGRRTISVDAHCQCIVRAWGKLSQPVREYIQRLVDEAFRRDEMRRAKGDSFRELGYACDCESWSTVRKLWQ